LCARCRSLGVVCELQIPETPLDRRSIAVMSKDDVSSYQGYMLTPPLTPSTPSVSSPLRISTTPRDAFEPSVPRRPESAQSPKATLGAAGRMSLVLTVRMRREGWWRFAEGRIRMAWIPLVPVGLLFNHDDDETETVYKGRRARWPRPGWSTFYRSHVQGRRIILPPETPLDGVSPRELGRIDKTRCEV
jgi:hypothetical protein